MAYSSLEEKKVAIEAQREAMRREEAAHAARTPNFEDVRLMIREEIRAALREERSGGWVNSAGDNRHEIPLDLAARFQAEFEAHARALGDMRRSWQAPNATDGSHQAALPRDYSDAIANARLNERDVPAGEYALNRIA